VLSPARSSFAYPVLLCCCGLRGEIGANNQDEPYGLSARALALYPILAKVGPWANEPSPACLETDLSHEVVREERSTVRNSKELPRLAMPAKDTRVREMRSLKEPEPWRSL